MADRLEEGLLDHMLIIGLDDTDTLESRGTGHLARQIASALGEDYAVLGVTRHQLLFDSRVPYTKKNSCSAIILNGEENHDPADLLGRVTSLMRDDYQPGSDPGLCVAQTVLPAIIEFGRATQQRLVEQSEARDLAAAHSLPLVGLGGTEDGVIGALAAVGLAATGEDGRYVQVGRLRELEGMLPVRALLEAGIAAVQTLDGKQVTTGLVCTDRLRPARRGSLPIAFVEMKGDFWSPLKLD